MSAAKKTVNATPYMTQVGGRWHLQLRVPRKLVAVYGGKATIWESLETDDRRLAADRRDRRLAQYKQDFARLRSQPAHVVAALSRAGGVDAMLKAHATTIQTRDALAQTVAYTPSAEALAHAAANHPGAPDTEHPKSIAELQDIMHAARDLAPVLDAANAKVASQQSILQSIGLGAPDNPLRLSVVSARYLELTRLQRTPKAADKIRARLAAFIEAQGDLAIDAPGFRDACERYLIARKEGGTRISTAQIDARDMMQICGWLHARGEIARNPVVRLPDVLGKDTRAGDTLKDAFAPGEIAALLATARTSWDPDHADALATLAGTGLRASEVLQLRPADVRQLTALDVMQDHARGAVGAWVLDVNTDADTHPTAKDWAPRHVKAPQYTRRLAPIHRNLLPLLLAAKARNAHAARVFTTVARPDSDDAVKRLGKMFTALMVRAKVDKNGRTLSLHSLRQTVAAVCQRARWTPTEVQSMLGKAFDGDAYGARLKAGELQAMVDALPLLGAL